MGFEIFGFPHIIWLAIGAGSYAAVIALSKRIPAGSRKLFARILVFAVLAFYTSEILYRLWEGRLNIGTLPLHICSMSVYLIILNELFPRSFFEGALFFPCLPGAAAAVIFPDWTGYAPFSLFSSIGFLAHLTIIWYILHKLAVRQIRPRPAQTPDPLRRRTCKPARPYTTVPPGFPQVLSGMFTNPFIFVSIFFTPYLQFFCMIRL